MGVYFVKPEKFKGVDVWNLNWENAFKYRRVTSAERIRKKREQRAMMTLRQGPPPALVSAPGEYFTNKHAVRKEIFANRVSNANDDNLEVLLAIREGEPLPTLRKKSFAKSRSRRTSDNLWTKSIKTDSSHSLPEPLDVGKCDEHDNNINNSKPVLGKNVEKEFTESSSSEIDKSSSCEGSGAPISNKEKPIIDKDETDENRSEVIRSSENVSNFQEDRQKCPETEDEDKDGGNINPHEKRNHHNNRNTVNNGVQNCSNAFQQKFTDACLVQNEDGLKLKNSADVIGASYDLSSSNLHSRTPEIIFRSVSVQTEERNEHGVKINTRPIDIVEKSRNSTDHTVYKVTAPSSNESLGSDNTGSRDEGYSSQSSDAPSVPRINIENNSLHLEARLDKFELIENATTSRTATPRPFVNELRPKVARANENFIPWREDSKISAKVDGNANTDTQRKSTLFLNVPSTVKEIFLISNDEVLTFNDLRLTRRMIPLQRTFSRHWPITKRSRGIEDNYVTKSNYSSNEDVGDLGSRLLLCCQCKQTIKSKTLAPSERCQPKDHNKAASFQLVTDEHGHVRKSTDFDAQKVILNKLTLSKRQPYRKCERKIPYANRNISQYHKNCCVSAIPHARRTTRKRTKPAKKQQTPPDMNTGYEVTSPDLCDRASSVISARKSVGDESENDSVKSSIDTDRFADEPDVLDTSTGDNRTADYSNQRRNDKSYRKLGLDVNVGQVRQRIAQKYGVEQISVDGDCTRPRLRDQKLPPLDDDIIVGRASNPPFNTTLPKFWK